MIEIYLEYQKVRTEHLYMVGYCREIDKYLMVITVPYACYYNQYYIISQGEYDLWCSDVEMLDRLAVECRKGNTHSARFLYSDRPEENTKEQSEFSSGEIARRKYNPVFDRI